MQIRKRGDENLKIDFPNNLFISVRCFSSYSRCEIFSEYQSHIGSLNSNKMRPLIKIEGVPSLCVFLEKKLL
jgi:hypothetical protein